MNDQHQHQTLSIASQRNSPLATPSDLRDPATRDIAGALNAILADVFALYLKTRNFHWHMTGPHFHSYRAMLEAHAGQLLATTGPIAERVRKLGAPTLHSIGQIARMQRFSDNDATYVEPSDMLAELREDNQTLGDRLREVHGLCATYHDIATAGMIEHWVDQAEGRTWFMFEAGRAPDSEGR